MTPPEKLRQIADEMERAKVSGVRSLVMVQGWRDRLAEQVAAMDASLDRVRSGAQQARRVRGRRG